ncbi:MAG: hypothetical protein ACFCUN_10930 [Hyphomicrobiaceae bacterium]
MAEPRLTGSGDDDLPRTLRRARDEQRARQRDEAAASARVVEGGASGARTDGAGLSAGDLRAEPVVPDGAMPFGLDDEDRVTVARFDVPFVSLVVFFFKCVFAAIPALVLLGAVLYGIGQFLKAYFPWIIQMEILIRFPG